MMRFIQLVLSFLYLFSQSFAAPATLDAEVNACGYASCPATKEGHLNVHLVPHSHDDVGWLKTVQQYYNGERNEIQKAEVRQIITTVVEELEKSPDRRFIQVESAFFWRWWNEQNDTKRELVRKLVNNGQLEIMGGGWSVNDEACTHYTAIIDQMSLGLRFLNDTFGSCAHPKGAWQIDPFGHSVEQASLFAEMGFESLFFGRLDYQDKNHRIDTKNMEFVWNANTHLGKSSSIFTSVLRNLYQPPAGFCYDTVFCSDTFSEAKVDDFIQKANDWAAPYRTNHILMTMGSDFHFQDAESWYTNMDRLIEAVNARQSAGTKMNLLYSTPSCYLQELHRLNETWSTQTEGDFFPYAFEGAHDFWTGYYTSRPTFKYLIHKGGNFLQACKQLAGMTLDSDNSEAHLKNIFQLDEALGIMQHHDGITGTAKQHVTDDYSAIIDAGMVACEDTISAAFGKLENPDASPTPSVDGSHTFCRHLNVSECAASEGDASLVVTVYNPLHWTVSNSYVRVPVTNSNVQVEGPSGLLEAQVIPIPVQVQQIPGRKSNATVELVFPAENLAGLAITNFKLVQTEKEAISQNVKISEERKVSLDNFEIKNSVGVVLNFDGETNLLKHISFGNSRVNLSQNFFYYKSYTYGSTGRPSGAYIFRPQHPDDEPIPFSKPTINVYNGSHVTEVHQVFSPWVSQVIRLYETNKAIEFEWLVGPIPVDDNVGKEVITRFTSDLATNGAFYADANGRQLIRRERDSRPTWDYQVIEPVTGNYYPVNSRLVITEGEKLEDNKRTLILLNDRAQGGSSIHDGQMEIMLHRRCLVDDALGVGEALNERAFGSGLVARGKLWLVLAGEESGLPTSIHRVMAQEIFASPILAFRNLNAAEETKQSAAAKRFSGLSDILPKNCHLLSLEPLTDTKYLLRLENFYETNEAGAVPFTLDVNELKAVLGAQTLEETTLGGHQWLTDSVRFDWNVENPTQKLTTDDKSTMADDEDTINFTPMQIRTFIFSLEA